MNNSIKANVKELSYVIKTTFGAPLDVRFLVSSLSKLSEELPIPLRYEGLIIYIQDISYFFYFRGGVENINCKPYNNIDVVTLETIANITTIPLSVRYRGMCVWIKNTFQMYVFDTGVSDSDLHPYNKNDVKCIDALADIATILPTQRFVGQLVWVKSLQQLYVFKNGIADIDLKPYRQIDLLTITNYSDVSKILPANRFVGQIVYVTNEQSYYSFSTGIADVDLKPLQSQNIIYIDTLSHMSTIPETSRYIGQFVFVKDTHTIFIFKNGIGDGDLKPINGIDIKSIATPSNVSTIQSSIRFIGQLVWIESLQKFWVFKGGIADANLVPYNQIDIVKVNTYLGEFGVQSIPTQQRFVGMLIYVEDEKHYYTFSGGLTNSHIVPLRDCSVVSLSSFDALNENNLPSRVRWIGQLVYCEKQKSFYTFKKNINNLELFISSNTVIVSSFDALDTELPLSQRYVGQMVYIQSVNMMCIFGNDINTLQPLVQGSDIVKINTIANAKDIPTIKRIQGQLVFVKDTGLYYTFKNGILDTDLEPLNQFDIVSLPSISTTLSVALPKDSRYIGQIIYAVDEDSYYYFKSGTADSNLIKLNQFDIRTIPTYSALSTIKASQRFEGSLVYTLDTKSYFSFVGGIDDINLVPLRSANTIVVNAYADIAKISNERRYIGQIYYVKTLNMLFAYKNSIANSDLEPINAIDIISVTNINELNDTPIQKRFVGQLAYVSNIKMIYQCVLNASNVLIYSPFNQLDIISVQSKSNLDVLNPSKKYPGLIGYVIDEKQYYSFNELGTPEPLKSTNLLIVNTWLESNAIPTHVRYIGQQVFIITEQRTYCYKSGTLNNNLVPIDNVFVLSTLAKLATEIPLNARQKGQYVWVADLQQMRVFIDTNTLLRVRDEVVSIPTSASLEALKNVEKRPYIVLDNQKNATLVWRDSTNRYVDINSNAVKTGETVASLLASLSKDIYDEQRVVGRLYYITSLGVHYTFVDGIDDVNFKALESNYIIPTLINIETMIPPEKRYIGMQFYVIDEAVWYYFQDINTYKKQQGFTQFSDKLNLSGDYEYVHNKNVNSIILEVRNDYNEVVDLPYRMGYANETGKTEQQKQFGRRNIITLSTDVPGLYTLYMLAL